MGIKLNIVITILYTECIVVAIRY